MIGYLKPYYKNMPIKLKAEYRSVYCGLCHTIKSVYGYTGALCLNYEVTVFLILILALQEEEKEIFHGSCSMTPFLRVPFIDYLSVEFINAATISVIIASYEIEDNLEDEKSLKWIIAEKLLHKCSKRAQYFLDYNYEQIQFFVHEYYLLEKSSELDFMSVLIAAGRMIEAIISPIVVNCKEEWGKIILQLANTIGQWIYIMDACDDWVDDEKRDNFNPIKLISDSISIRSIVESIELRITDYLDILPIKHYKDLIHYMLIENIHKTSCQIMDKYESEIHIYGS